MGYFNYTTPVETSNRGGVGVPIFIQDQTTGLLDLPFLLSLNTSLLAVDTVSESRLITLAPGHGAVAGNTIEIASISNGSLFQQAEVISVATDVITIDSPVVRVFTVADSQVNISERNMNVVGTPEAPVAFQVAPTAVQLGDMVRLILTMTDTVDMDFTTFGGLPALTYGIVLRVHTPGGNHRQIQNFKSNGDIARYAYDTEYFDNKGGGVRGFHARLTFGGQSKHGAVIRLDGSLGEHLEILVQDDLTGLVDMDWMAQGSEVQN